MDGDWERLGRTVQAARKAKGLTQTQLVELIGVTRATLVKIEAGKQFSKITDTHRALEEALGWQAGSIELILGGGDPAPQGTPAGEPVAPASLAEALPLRVRQALGAGSLIDATVIDLPSEGSTESEAQIVIVVKGKPAASAESMRQAIEAWEKVERKLRAMDTDPQDDTGPTSA
ncbi:helix-turn-helix transcriptional regulator [Streptomyces ehimensis]|uniref:Helix-turn-helix transcriptional regulator n=1 Tax=Streptomyces ehimensis TaxID=68195 RepID=A0ABV9BF09_9ACTN